MASSGGTELARACNICGLPWPNHVESCAYAVTARELEAIKATHLYRWIEKCQVAREALAEIRDLDPGLTHDGYERDELSSYSGEVQELAVLALESTE